MLNRCVCRRVKLIAIGPTLGRERQDRPLKIGVARGGVDRGGPSSGLPTDAAGIPHPIVQHFEDAPNEHARANSKPDGVMILGRRIGSRAENTSGGVSQTCRNSDGQLHLCTPTSGGRNRTGAPPGPLPGA